MILVKMKSISTIKYIFFICNTVSETVVRGLNSYDGSM
jgi:hypothetical protein